MRSAAPLLVLFVLAACDSEPPPDHTEALAKISTQLDSLSTRVEALEARPLPTPPPAPASGADPTDAIDALSARIDTLTQNLDVMQTTITEVQTSVAEVVAAKEAEIGVPECDEYIAYYGRCIDEKLPVAARETSKRALATSVKAWKRVADTPHGREGLKSACATARKAVSSICDP